MQDTQFDWRPSLALIAIALLFWVSKFAEVSAGIMPGNDDMMRLVQVRDLLAGQGWYDVDQSRFITPEGGAMHWSRIPDLFMAAIIVLLTPVIGAGAAETVAIMAWPMTLLAVTLSMIALIMKRLGAGTLGAALAVFFYLTTKSVLQFWPARIDHHGLEIMLVTVAMAALLAPRASRMSGVLAGASVAAMVGVAIESLPYAGLLVAFAGMSWVIRGAGERQRLAGFGLGAGVMALALYLFDAPGPGPARAVCDAFGNFHLAALMTGGGLLLGLSMVPERLMDRWQKRLGGGAGAGIATLLVAGLVAPGCFGSPYAAVDAAAAENWLANVSEARSIFAVIATEPEMALSDMGFALAALIAAGWLLFKAPSGRRLGWTLVAVMALVSTAVMAWQIRGYLFAHMFAALAAGALAGRAFQGWREEGGPRPLLIAGLIALSLSPKSWQIAAARLFEAPPASSEVVIDHATTCREADAYERLAALPAGRVMAPVDLGTSILLRTPHAIYAAPYHRNGGAIAQATTLFMSPPQSAHAELVSLEADYFVFCQGLNEFDHYALAAPGSLADRLQAGDLPEWLEPADGLTQTDGVVRVYRVAPLETGGDIS